jgi:hypothetical protein
MLTYYPDYILTQGDIHAAYKIFLACNSYASIHRRVRHHHHHQQSIC